MGSKVSGWSRMNSGGSLTVGKGYPQFFRTTLFPQGQWPWAAVGRGKYAAGHYGANFAVEKNLFVAYFYVMDFTKRK